MEEKIFQTLYGIDKTNKIKEWNIQVKNKGDHSVILYSYGFLDGKKVECNLKILKGKNIGKKNETNHFQQAIFDAQSKWKKKVDIDGYKLSKEELILTNQNQQLQLIPMLAQEYKKHSKKLLFPCYIQPKLDGYRMIYNSTNGKITTRTGKEYKILYNTELYKELEQISHNLDGELYVHDTKFNFENYGILRKQKSLTLQEQNILGEIEYHVYDIIDQNKPYIERLEILQSLFVNNNFTKIKFVQTDICNNISDIESYHHIHINNNYEGSILRNKNSLYKCKYRSFDLLKYKDFDDGEFPIIDFTSENDTSGNDENLVIWICETEQGKRFNVQSKGTKEERQMIYKRAAEFVGKKLWVQHFGWTQDGIPRFPKTMRSGLESIRENII